MCDSRKEKDAQRRILVTGGAGFIGSAVCRHLIQDTAANVCNVDKLTYAGSLSSLQGLAANNRYLFHRADVADADTMSAILSQFAPTAVIHLAAESHVDRSITSPGTFIQTNIVGTYTMLQCALHFWSSLTTAEQARFRFLHVSTDEVFGSLDGTGRFTEESRYEPRSPYSASKASSDHLARAWFHTYGLPTIVSNCSNNYGPYHFPEKLIPLTIINAIEDRRLPVYGTGANVRDWLYVEDHARALDRIVEHGRPGETYNVGGAGERRNVDVVMAICALLDELSPRRRGEHRDLIEFVTDRPGHDHRYAIDASKLQSELGWSALETFETGLRKTVEWYLANEAWWRPLRDRYRGERLGLRELG